MFSKWRLNWESWYLWVWRNVQCFVESIFLSGLWFYHRIECWQCGYAKSFFNALQCFIWVPVDAELIQKLPGVAKIIAQTIGENHSHCLIFFNAVVFIEIYNCSFIMQDIVFRIKMVVYCRLLQNMVNNINVFFLLSTLKQKNQI